MRRWPGADKLVCFLLIIVYAISGLALLGYILQLPFLYQWSTYVGMAPNTAIVNISLATAGIYHIISHNSHQ